MSRSRGLAAVLLLGLLAPDTARAHFLWLVAGDDGGRPRVDAFLSETPDPDLPEFLRSIEHARITSAGEALAWTKGGDTYRVRLPEPTPGIIDGFCDLGVMSRQGATFRLLYTARVQFGPSPEGKAEAADHLRLRLVARPGRPPVVAITFRGRPAPGATVKAFPEEGEPFEVHPDEAGRLECPGVAEGRTGLLARFGEEGPGEFEGKPYPETRHYATLTVAPAPVARGANADRREGAGADEGAHPHAPFALLPEAVNSFGGAVAGDWLYAYSGHVAAMHRYDEQATTKHFRRLNLRERGAWEELPPGPALQGVTLLAHGGKLYRIGGTSARNRPSEPDDLVSVADFARFDPETRRWTDLPPLPAPRSTHDAVVVGDRIYVVGGWSMNGGDASNADFHEDALVFDLSREDARWEALPSPPFRRRALAVGALGGKIYVIGGLTEGGRVVKSVDVYDPARRAWSRGPDLPGGRLEGFAPSAFEVGGRLYVSGHDGVLRRLSPEGDAWEDAGKLAVPRLTHRLLPGIAGDLLAVGGTFAQVPVRFVESIPTDGPSAGPKAVAWAVPLGTEARQGQAAGLIGATLFVAGGNRGTEPHDFSAANLVGESARASLGTLEAEAIAPLPEPRQSASFVVARDGRKGVGYLLGGIGADGDVARTPGRVFRLDPESGRWSLDPATIRDGRGMFGAAAYGGSIWLFGGSVFDPRSGGQGGAMPTDVLRWDPSQDGSTFAAAGPSIPRARRSFAGAVLGSKYYLVGGLGADREPVEVVDVFDFEHRTWSTIASPRHPRLFADMAAVDGKLYLAGGLVKPGGGRFEPARTIEVYDPATGAWAALDAPLPVPPGHLRAFAIQGRLLLYAPDPEAPGRGCFALLAP